VLGAKIVLNIHDMMPELYMSKFEISQEHWLVRLLKFEERCSVRLADKVICVHHPHRDVLVSRGTPLEKITVLPNVPDPSIMANGDAASTANSVFRIVFHGTIARRLGLELAVKAFENVAGSCPCARLEIYGDGDAADALEAQIAASSARSKINFSRKMFRVEAIAQMIQGASVGVIPNLRDVATDLMLPVKLLEYVHLGIPVIAPRLRTIEYYFTEGQVAYYEPGNADELAACIRRLYVNAMERAKLSQACMAFVEKFNWQVLKEDLFKVVDA
jgi:glycosyltransferase involved in cell wall biosynthesis